MSNFNVNQVVLIGHMGKTPKVFEANAEREAFAVGSLATNEYWKGKDGQTQSKTTWHNLIFPKHLLKVVEPYVVSGSKLYVEGKLSARAVEASSGESFTITSIIVEKMGLLSKQTNEQTTAVEVDTKPTPEDYIAEAQAIINAQAA